MDVSRCVNLVGSGRVMTSPRVSTVGITYGAVTMNVPKTYQGGRNADARKFKRRNANALCRHRAAGDIRGMLRAVQSTQQRPVFLQSKIGQRRGDIEREPF